jgi:hypothetical protein
MFADACGGGGGGCMVVSTTQRVRPMMCTASLSHRALHSSWHNDTHGAVNRTAYGVTSAASVAAWPASAATSCERFLRTIPRLQRVQRYLPSEVSLRLGEPFPSHSRARPSHAQQLTQAMEHAHHCRDESCGRCIPVPQPRFPSS